MHPSMPSIKPTKSMPLAAFFFSLFLILAAPGFSQAPQIRTPKAPDAPRVNGPAIFGVRPGSPFLYKIPATGKKPLGYSVKDLPAGLKLDSATGMITGKLAAPGEHSVTLVAKNALGSAEKKFRIVAGETIALTPPLGWSSWNVWGPEIDQEKTLANAKVIAESGLIDHGWTYINIDDAWQGKRGGEFNAIQPNEKFPDMQGLCDAIHKLGLKPGIYSTPWITSYGGFCGGSADNPEGIWPPPLVTPTPAPAGRPAPTPDPRRRYSRHMGKYSFAANDAKQWAAWGIDYMKYDWNPNEVPETKAMADALRASGRDIVYSLSNSTPFRNMDALGEIANVWRTSGDIGDNWKSMSERGFSLDRWAKFCRPGHWNDPDMMVIGWLGGAWRGWLGNTYKNTPQHASKLTPDEQYTHVTIWAMVDSPLLIGADLTKMDDFTFNLLSNDEVLAVNQDALGKQATAVDSWSAQTVNTKIYAKPLEDGTWAVALFNLENKPAAIHVAWSALKLTSLPKPVRDLWRQKDLGLYAGGFPMTVAPHSAELLKIGKAAIF